MRRKAGFALLICATLAAGCAPTIRQHGYVPSQDNIAKIRVGVDDMARVEEVLGRPSSNGVLRDTAWYYVASTMENYTYHAPRVINRTVLAVRFGPNGKVRSIDRYGLQDGKVVNLTTRTTDTGGRELSVIEQLFSNMMRLNSSQFQDQ